MSGREKRRRLPEERQFSAVLLVVCALLSAFLCMFAVMTFRKWKLSPQDIAASWFEAWGTWAGGLMTGAAFLIAAYSIAVSSAHSREDRYQASRIQESKDVAQARLLTVYQVDMPDQPSSMRFFRIDNRSNDRFFDVSVNEVIRSKEGVEQGRLDSSSARNTLQFLPHAELLTAYRTQDANASWFTEVRIYAAPDEDVQFSVDYTDAAGNQWKQQIDGRIERVITKQAVPQSPRKADFVQPHSQIRILTDQEAKEMGLAGSLQRQLTGEDDTLLDDGEIELSSGQLAAWLRVGRIGTPRAVAASPDQIILEIPYGPKPPAWHPWTRYFRDALKRNGLADKAIQFHSQGDVEEVRLQVPLTELESTIETVSRTIDLANAEFEAREHPRAVAIVQAKKEAEKSAAEFQARLDERVGKFAAPGRVPWHRNAAQRAEHYPRPNDESIQDG